MKYYQTKAERGMCSEWACHRNRHGNALYCHTHQLVRRGERPNTPIKFKAPEGWNKGQRISEHLEVDDNGCWIWTRGKSTDGYGRIGWGGNSYLVHRVVYEQYFGPIPDGDMIDHVYTLGCRSKACCSPFHLEAVTPEENERRKHEARYIQQGIVTMEEAKAARLRYKANQKLANS